MATLYLEEKENDASSFDLFVFITLQAVEFRYMYRKRRGRGSLNWKPGA